MSTRVDRNVRRMQIVEAYIRVAARDGVGAATSRSVARELGIATGAIWHYFENFDELLAMAFQLIFERTTVRIRAVIDRLRGLPALRASLLEILPTRPVTQNEAQVVSGFWGRVASKPELGRMQIRVEAEWRAILVRCLEDAIADEGLRADAPVTDIFDLL